MPDPSKREVRDRPTDRRKSPLAVVELRQEAYTRLIVSLAEQILGLKDRIEALEKTAK